jgi:hypothetical protein
MVFYEAATGEEEEVGEEEGDGGVKEEEVEEGRRGKKTATGDRRYGCEFPIMKILARRVLDYLCRDAPGGPTEMP